MKNIIEMQTLQVQQTSCKEVVRVYRIVLFVKCSESTAIPKTGYKRLLTQHTYALIWGF